MRNKPVQPTELSKRFSLTSQVKFSEFQIYPKCYSNYCIFIISHLVLDFLFCILNPLNNSVCTWPLIIVGSTTCTFLIHFLEAIHSLANMIHVYLLKLLKVLTFSINSTLSWLYNLQIWLVQVVGGLYRAECPDFFNGRLYIISWHTKIFIALFQNHILIWPFSWVVFSNWK